MIRPLLLATLALMSLTAPASAEDLYKPSGWSAMSADRTARQVGDALTIVVYQAAEATNSAKSDSSKSSRLGGQISAGSLNESGNLSFGGGYTGGGQVQRSERFVTQITVVVSEVLPNGDLIVTGEQQMRVNGETSNIGVRGRVRLADINAENMVASNRVANAQINYDGRGFVSKSARPGLINRVFRFLGLG
ncbi:flagellar basal body L-ring protein FlgH [Sphingomonas sp. So64.6b]|uniref:flagellar basal body L-ring protein FlgH n=1 Tax=Sphingomonas sp. So64.6b TaxID=2997354 RepID=UPI0016024941|nr:flagellar basal body L-ring protein FlgH [Sphingomonas sp. So64.6b]QNA82924.1 flagellar basal body L-ring protein FlgH [Sphingomonas sp. So64.6b]